MNNSKQDVRYQSEQGYTMRTSPQVIQDTSQSMYGAQA